MSTKKLNLIHRFLEKEDGYSSTKAKPEHLDYLREILPSINKFEGWYIFQQESCLHSFLLGAMELEPIKDKSGEYIIKQMYLDDISFNRWDFFVELTLWVFYWEGEHPILLGYDEQDNPMKYFLDENLNFRKTSM